jgi:ubiquinol-cytochrome c reductase cytochrome c1 subunit
MMKSIKTIVLGASLALALVSGVHAAGGNTIAWDKAPQKTTDTAALQNGAKLFVNYCLSCHSAAFMRFNRLQDIGLTEQQIKDNLLFTTEKIGETMKANVDPKQANEWFGANPPDLTLIARAKSAHGGGKGHDYLYTFLRTYYRDESKATGWNNLAFPSVGMPNPLWELQGERKPIFEERVVKGHTEQFFTGKWEQVKPGLMTPQQYDEAVGDLVAYLQWMAEPVQHQRVRVGVWVLLFLGVFTLVAWRLNAAYWKDVK